jgi:two-component system, chemotaxis family, CheB/CheR fusion protein
MLSSQETSLPGSMFITELRDLTEKAPSGENALNEPALPDNEIQSSSFFDLAAVGLAQVDAVTGRFMRVNEKFAAITGYRKDELLRMMPVDLTHPEDQPRHRQIYSQLLRGETDEHSIEKRYVRKDGEVIWVQLAVKLLRGLNGRPLRTIGVTQDISERKRAEQAAARLAAIVTSSEDAIISNSPDAKILTWNHGAEKLFGWRQDEAIGQPVTILVPPDRLHETKAFSRKLARGEAVHQFETVRMRKDGSSVDVSLTLSPILVNGEAVAISAIVRNISERKRAERELKNADRRKDEFLATVAHELRNPLAPIRNAVEMLAMRDSADGEVDWARKVIDREVSYLSRLVDDLLEISRIRRNKLELRKEPTVLAEILTAAVDATRPLLAQRRHRLELPLEPAAVQLRADPIRLTQVLINLLTNAAKYTPEGGRIRIAVQLEGKHVLVRVKDNGIGIAADQMPHLFDMFYQANRSTEPAQAGLGIGLTLVRHLVKLHGGTVAADSAGLGQGSEFIVRLPLDTEPARAVERSSQTESKPAAIRRILIADDYPGSAESLARWLRRFGHEVHTAVDGLQAFEAAQTTRPEVVLLDLGMPKLNGYDVAREIRAQPWGKRMVLIALTGWAREEDRRRTREAGFDAHLAKPLSYPQLISSVNELPKRTEEQ